MDPTAPQQQPEAASVQPGDTITPGSSPQAAPAVVPSAQPIIDAVPVEAAPETSAPAFDVGAQLQSIAVPRQGADDHISWTASEFIAHEKSAGWFALLALGGVVVIAIIWLLTKSIFSVVFIGLLTITFGIYSARKPKARNYQLDDAGLTIDDKFQSYDDFRSFAVIPEGALTSIDFMPQKRFSAITTIYYDPADEDKVMAILSSRLPFESSKRDVVDQFMKRIRF